MTKKRTLLLTTFLLVCATSCHNRGHQNQPQLISMQIIDRNGFSETIGSKDRLNPYKNTDFLSTQPYQKVLRVFAKDMEGKSHSTLTTYHPNGQISEYLDIVDGRAHGTYRKWFANGNLNVHLTVLDGTADLNAAAQKSWLFDGKASIYDERGNTEAEIFYSKGVLDTPSLYYHPNGQLQKKSPFINGLMHGEEIIFNDQGDVIETRLYQKGKREGISTSYWDKETIQFEEHYADDLLLTASYFDASETLVSSIENGEGFQSHFTSTDGALAELHEFREGKPEGIIKFFNKSGHLVHSYCVKEGMKHGEEWKYYPQKDPDIAPQPKMMVTWHEDVLQGTVKTWYPTGIQESSREMHQNKKQGYSFAWFTDGSLLLSEEYNQNSLVKGSYYQKGNSRPISTVSNGKGTASLYDPEGKFCKKIPYESGKPLLSHN